MSRSLHRRHQSMAEPAFQCFQRMEGQARVIRRAAEVESER
jgi:hypothetical protein